MPNVPSNINTANSASETESLNNLGGRDDTAQYVLSDSKQVKVYVTGFGPFLNIVDNPSYSIASSFLPSTDITVHLPSNIHPSKKLHITIIPHQNPIKVAYATIDTLIPDIYSTISFDYIIHIGAGLKGSYYIENVAYKDGYLRGDVDGLLPGGKTAMPVGELRKLIRSGEIVHWGGDRGIIDVDPRKEKEKEKEEEEEDKDSNSKGGEWLGTALDTEWIAKYVSSGLSSGDNIFFSSSSSISTEKKEINSTSAEVKENSCENYLCSPSFNAGRYICEYIYYTSAREAICRRRLQQHPSQGGNCAAHSSANNINQRDNAESTYNVPEETSNTTKRVLFLHVPEFGHPYSLEDGREVLKRLIIAMVLDAEGLRENLR